MDGDWQRYVVKRQIKKLEASVWEEMSLTFRRLSIDAGLTPNNGVIGNNPTRGLERSFNMPFPVVTKEPSKFHNTLPRSIPPGVKRRGSLDAGYGDLQAGDGAGDDGMSLRSRNL